MKQITISMHQAGLGRLHPKILFLAILIAGALAIFALPPREPRYQGRSLTDWLNDLTAESMPHPPAITSEILAVRRDRAVAAIRQMGTNTLPRLLAFLSADAKPSFARKKLEYLLQKQSFIALRLPVIPDHHQQAIEAFRVLGPAAKPAIGKLAELLESGTNYWSVECLKAIGPDSVAALIKAMN